MHLSYNEWNHFIKTEALPNIRPQHESGWKQSLAMGVNPYADRIGGIVDPSIELEGELKSFMEEVMGHIEFTLKDTRNLRLSWVLCDSSGRVISVMGENEPFKEYLDLVGIQRGASMTIEASGANAVSMAMEVEHRFFCIREENFVKCLHELVSLATPIYSIDGVKMGYISIFAHSEDIVVPQLLSMINLLVRGVDTRTRLERSSNFSNHLRNVLSELFTEDDHPILSVNRNGYLRQMNAAAIKLFDIDPLDVEKYVDKLANFSPSIKDIASCATNDNDLKLEISLSDKKLKMSCIKRACYSDKDEFMGVILQFREESRKKTRDKESALEATYKFDDIVGNTPAIKRAKLLARQVAPTSISVLLTGESGTGKEMFAQSIHNGSEFSDGPFVSLNCAAIPREIAESELFGYTEGAFTGALKEGKMGKVEAASGGTLFLDEIGDMPLDLQAKLLRVLETKQVTRLGENKGRKITLRVIAATNVDLQELIDEKQFREDLFYRLAVSTIHLPSLRESKDDIPELFMSFVEYYNERTGKKVFQAKEGLMENIRRYEWKGNIRELRNAAEFAVMMNNGNEPITLKHLPGKLRMSVLYHSNDEVEINDPLGKERSHLIHSEELLIDKALKMANGRVEDAAANLGVSRATMYRKIKKLGLK